MAYTLTTLLGLLFLVSILSTSTRSFFARRMPPRAYSAKPLSEIIADMENQGLIPLGTTWENEGLKARKVTVSYWLLPTDLDALDKLASAAGVVIEIPVEVEAQVVGSARVRSISGGRPGLELIYPRTHIAPRYRDGTS